MTKLLLLLAAALAAAVLGPAADAAVLCQKGKSVKLRADACRPKETQVAKLGGDGELAGVWELTGGVFQTLSSQRADFLVLNADGSGTLHASGGDGPVVSCVPFNYSRDTNGTIVLDDLFALVDTRVYRFAQESGDSLELVDAVGNAAQFDRASAVDPGKECPTLVQAGRLTGLPRPAQSSGLVFDGTDLWFTEDDTDRIVSLDPATGELGLALENGSTFVHAAQGADFWAHCNCGGSEEAFRATRPGTTVDTIETATELGEELSIDAIAFQGAGGFVWIYGFNDANEGRLMKVDPSGEPDVLVQTFDLDADISGMTFSGNDIWAVNEFGQTVMRIDSATGQVTGTFLLPDRTARWRGIAAIGDQLFVLGESSTPSAAPLEAARGRARDRAKAAAALDAAPPGVVLVVEKPS